MENIEVQQTLSDLKKLENIWGEKYLYENEYFRVLRFRENEFKAKYRINLFKKIYLYLFFIPSSFIKFFINILFILFKPGKEIQKSKLKHDFLFVSHLTKSNPNLEGEDRIYGQYLNNNFSRETITVYFNHSKLNEKLELKINDNFNRNILLLPKNLQIRVSLNCILSIYLDALRKYFLFCFKSKFPSIIDKRLAIRALYSQVSRRSISNHFIYVQFIKLLQSSNISNVIIPFEGHAYEYVIKRACKIYPKTNLIFFQHAPVSRGQFSMMNKTLIENNIVLFSSELVKKWFIKNKILDKAKALTIGSPKFVKVKKRNVKTNTILLTPEGLNTSLFNFLKAIPEIKKIFCNYRILLRLHPDMRMTLLNYFVVKLFVWTNRLEVSKCSLISDLEKSKYCIFTASSVGLEAIANKCIPIFFGSALENELTNPLFIYEGRFKIFTFTELTSKTKNLPKLEIFYTNYYNKLNPRAIYDFIEKFE